MNTDASQETDIVALIIDASSSDGFVRITPEKHAQVKKLLNRYALAVVEQSLPEEQEVREDGMTCNYSYAFNSCRSQVLENALRIVGGGENEEEG